MLSMCHRGVADLSPVLFMLNGKGFADLSIPNLLLAGKLNYAIQPFYWINQSLAKLSLLYLYNRVFWVEPAIVRAIYGVGAIHVSFTTAVILIVLFGCQPLAKGWAAALPGSCLTTSPRPFLAVTESINSTIDFAMVIIAAIIVSKMGVRTSTKLKLSILFALGGLAGIIGFVKIGQFYDTNPSRASRSINTTLGLWAVVQQACSVICCSAPIYKNILPPDNFLRRVVNTAYSSWSTWTKGSKSDRSDRQSSYPHGQSDQNAEKESSHGSGSQKGGWLRHGPEDNQVSADKTKAPSGSVYPVRDLRIDPSVERLE
ncbi:hypothetical protein GQ53DRAFT_7412 [Thozetella sp. PMI_491]|nr:hypothetical protein GQ53DRAFT_7412 [Thozetella sp. PMI_491]